MDPTLGPKVFWRALAARCPLDPPRSLDDLSLVELAQLLAFDQDAKIILQLREYVDERLGLLYEDKWRTTWYQYGYGKMSNPLDRDMW